MSSITDTSAGPDQGPAPLTPDQIGRVRRVLSRSPYYVDDNAKIRVNVTSAVVPVTVAVHYRRGLPDGTTPPAEVAVTVSQAYITTSKVFDLGECLLFNVAAFVKTGAPQVGQCYVTVDLVQGDGPNAFMLGALIGRQVTANQPAGWPGTPVQTSTETEPAIRTIIGTAPAPNVELHETVPAGARWELLSWFALLTTDATVGNRQYIVSYQVAGLPFQVLLPLTAIQPSKSEFTGFSPNMVGNTSSTFQADTSASPQPLIMRGGDSLSTFTIFVGPADFWGAPRYSVREWLEVP